jgi:general secretion pathway protein L
MDGLPERFRRAAVSFLVWWAGELASIVPHRLRRALSARGRILVLDEVGSELIVSRFGEGGCREIGRVRGAPDGASEGKATSRLEAPVPKGTRLVVRLAQHHALRKLVELPLAAEENLREVIRFEMARLTPFTAEQVYFAARIAGRDLDASALRVELTVARRGVVDRLRERVAPLGLRPHGACLAGDDPQGGPILDLDPEGEKGGRAPAWGRPSLYLAALAAGLALAVVYVPLERKQSQVEALAGLLVEARAEAEAVQQLRAEIDRVRAESRFAFQRRNEAPTVLAVLNELTERLPDGTWLFQLQLRQNELQILGYSPAASSLIAIIEQSPLFENARFRSPVTRDARLGAEQFHVSADLVPDGAAEPGEAT